MTSLRKTQAYNNTWPLISKFSLQNKIYLKLRILPLGFSSLKKITVLDMDFLFIHGIKPQARQILSKLERWRIFHLQHKIKFQRKLLLLLMMILESRQLKIMSLNIWKILSRLLWQIKPVLLCSTKDDRLFLDIFNGQIEILWCRLVDGLESTSPLLLSLPTIYFSNLKESKTVFLQNHLSSRDNLDKLNLLKSKKAIKKILLNNKSLLLTFKT